MRKKLIRISERFMMGAIANQLYQQAPRCQPRKSEIIMQKFGEIFRKDADNDNEYYRLMLEEENVDKWIHESLMTIDEFKELNLSQIEYEKGVNVEDDDRAKYSFSSAYDVETKDSWKSDFIDLDAFTRNVTRNLFMMLDFEEDCFCCMHKSEPETDICKSCAVNPKLKNNYECGREPKGSHKFACTYDCKKGYYIGCDECEKESTCEHRCEEKCNGCSLAINHIK